MEQQTPWWLNGIIIALFCALVVPPILAVIGYNPAILWISVIALVVFYAG